MILLVGLVAGIGYRSISSTAKNFEEFKRLSTLEEYINSVLYTQSNAVSNIYQFRYIADSKRTEAARNYFKESLVNLGKAREFARRPEILNAMAEIERNIHNMTQATTVMEKSVLGVLAEYEASMWPSIEKMLAAMMDLGKGAFEANAQKANERAWIAMEAVSAVRSAYSRMAYNQSEFNSSRTVGPKENLAREMETLRSILVTPRGLELFAVIQQAHTKMLAASASFHANTKAGLDQVAAVLAAYEANYALVSEISKNIAAQKNAQSNQASEAVASAVSQISIGAVAGLLIGALLAAFIIYGLVRVLGGMRRFAGAIAEGDFTAQVDSRERGEIGEMLAAMRQIPVVLQSIQNDYSCLEKRVGSGELAAKADPAAYKGGFSTLVTGTNAILDYFLKLLENIPSPIVALDKEFKAAYMNAAGRATAGADFKGRTCKQLMAREDYGSNADALKKAVESLRPASGETQAHPQGRKMDVSYTAVPMLDSAGKLCSVIQLITDITNIKETQRTIQSVADQAASIAGRVALASEELSAQVEQVSRGAEQQRTRVEGTATAMTEMNSTVLEVAKNAGQASEQSEATKIKANDGAALVNRVVESINQVNKVATTLQTNMQELGTQAESIGGVMNVISDIADQTNLLALNAAIEAARAGEAGRGFAVVADEVRKLAEKTMSATQEVGANISAIQNSTRINIGEVNQAAKAVTEATELANTSGKALAEIVDLASANSLVVASIATAAEEQSATSEEINQSIDEISRIVTETAKGMSQSAVAVQELSHMAQELNKVMGELR